MSDDREVMEPEFRSPGRTVTETDVIAFAGLSGDFHEAHTNAEAAADGPFGQRVAHGLLGLSMATGLLQRTKIGPDLTAFVGIKDWRFRQPVFLGDTVHLVGKVTARDDTRLPPRVTLNVQLCNQRGVVIHSGLLQFIGRARNNEDQTSQVDG